MAKGHDDKSVGAAKGLAVPGVIGAVIAVLLSLMALDEPLFITDMRLLLYDVILTRLTGHGELSDEPVMVDIDEKALAQIGQWSWPRFETARIFRAMADTGVSAIAADYLPADADRMSPKLWSDRLVRGLSIRPNISNIPDRYKDFDEIFARALRDTPSLICAELSDDPDLLRSDDIRSFPIREEREPGAPPLASFCREYGGAIMPIPILGEAARYVAAMNMEPSDDGIFRSMPIFVMYNGKPVASLFAAAVALAHGDSEIAVRVAPSGPVSATIAGIEVPIDSAGYMIVSPRPKNRPIKRYSAADVYNGAVGTDELRGKIAFFGSTASGLSDLRPTPYDPRTTSLEFHALAADTLLSRRFLWTPIHAEAIRVISIIAISVICVLVYSLCSPRLALACSVVTAASLWALCLAAALLYGVIVSPIFPMFALVAQSVQAFAARYMTEKKERVLLRSAFSNYVSPEVVSRIIAAGGTTRLLGETRVITVLFTDIRGFTTMTESMRPDSVASLLDAYFTPMTRIVRGSGGTLDKFIGDAMMAFWNAPLDVPDHPRAAASAFMEMRRALAEMGGELRERFGADIKIGGGLHTGPAHVGNMGTYELMDYTAIGDTVNTASRLEGMCTKYGVGSVMSEDVAGACGDLFALRPLDIVRVKGRHAAVKIFTALEPEAAAGREEEFRLWADAFDLYMAGDFTATQRICRELSDGRPDEKLYRVFLERSESLAVNHQGEWDGVYTYDTK